MGGLTAAVVALPPALAFRVASGAGPVAGVYGAIFVGLFGGTPAQVSGPMTVVKAAVFVQFADTPAVAFTVVMLAGLLQIGFDVIRIGQHISLMPFPVISGFMSGIGIIIIFLQLAPLIGHAPPPGGVVMIAAALPDLVQRPVVDALVVGLMVLAIVFLTPSFIARLVPAPLVALGVGTPVVLLWLPGAGAGRRPERLAGFSDPGDRHPPDLRNRWCGPGAGAARLHRQPVDLPDRR